MRINVGIADINIAHAPDTLVTYALGSCVGICLYDKANKIAGLAHILMPSSKNCNLQIHPTRYADTAIPLLIHKMSAAGADTQHLTAKIAGGSKMYEITTDELHPDIGKRNVLAVKDSLHNLHIPIIADDTHSDCARTLYFSAEDGSVLVKTDTREEWVL